MKTTLRYHFSLVRMAIINKATSNKQQVETGSRKGNPSTLLVGMQTGAATVENSREFPQKSKDGTAFWPSDSTAWNISKESWITSVFIAVLFKIAKYWKQSKCPLANEWIKKKKPNGTFAPWNTMQQKERIPIFYDSMDGTRGHYDKWNKPVNGRRIPYDLTYEKSNEQNKLEPLAWKHGTEWKWSEEEGRGIIVERRGRD